MSVVTSLKHQQPSFMAIEKEKTGGEELSAAKRKKWKVDKIVLLTWIAIIVLTIVFWYMILKLL
ncbi:hypothetical protein [Ilyomonas limi]|nr:hypothetical protein [Ilyomonas limi]